MQSHSTLIAEHIHTMFLTLEEHCTLPAAASARILTAMSRMLIAAAHADPDVALALANLDGSAILRLRYRYLECAKEADSDMNRPKWAADDWWAAYVALTDLLGQVIASLTQVDSINTFADSDRSLPRCCTCLKVLRRICRACTFTIYIILSCG